MHNILDDIDASIDRATDPKMGRDGLNIIVATDRRASMDDAETVVRDLFAHYLTDPEAMPEDWRQGLQAKDEASRALRAGDFIAGMTDRYAIVEHQRLFDSTPDLR